MGWHGRAVGASVDTHELVAYAQLHHLTNLFSPTGLSLLPSQRVDSVSSVRPFFACMIGSARRAPAADVGGSVGDAPPPPGGAVGIRSIQSGCCNDSSRRDVFHTCSCDVLHANKRQIPTLG
eukprot:3337220-Prymnesium_polylepis.1